MRLLWKTSRIAPKPDERQLVRIRKCEQEIVVEAVTALSQATHQIVRVAEQPFLTHLAEEDGTIAKAIQNHGLWEPAETMILAGLARPGTTVLDIGANVGYYTVALSRWIGKAGQVYAFEPEADNFLIVTLNASLVTSQESFAAPIHLFPVAVSDQEGEIALQVHSGNLGLHSIVDTPDESAASVLVPTVSLDTLRFGRNSRSPVIRERIDLIKSDAQGAELLILQGGERTINEDRPILCLEFEPYTGPNRCLELCRWLEGHGYAARKLFHADVDCASNSLSELSRNWNWEDVRRVVYTNQLRAYCTLIAYPH